MPWCYACIELTKKYNLDDALDVWAVHGMGGLLGTLCIGIFANNDVAGFEAGGKLFGKQLLAVVDEFGSLGGVVTMEDIIESILGQEIFEKDDMAIDMRELARNENSIENDPLAQHNSQKVDNS